MLFALISTFISSFSNVFWKKSLNYNIRWRAHELSSYPIPLTLLAYFILTWFSLSNLTFTLILTVVLILVIDVIKWPVEQSIYKEEKISVIMPYLNLSKVFVIISSFFIFKDVSYTALWITIFTIVIIAAGSIDFKTLKLPKNIHKLLFVESLRTVAILLGWWVVIKYGEISYFNTYVLFGLIIWVILVYSTQQMQDYRNVWISYWKCRTIWSIWWLSWFLSLVVIKSLGLSISILLGFIWVWVTLLFSYLFLWDKPNRKNILLTAVVSILIWIWYYFK